MTDPNKMADKFVDLPVYTPDVPMPAVVALMEPKQLEQRLTEYTESRTIFMRWVKDSLVAGVDYMLLHKNSRQGSQWHPCPLKAEQHAGKCPKCGAKPTLCKPGSEKICGLLQVTPRFRKDAEVWEMLGSPVGTIALVCELVNAQGQVVAEGRGIRALAQDENEPNKAVKMCQKSGQIDACLRLVGLSEVFTLDLEDMSPMTAETIAAEAFPPPRRTTTPEATAGKGADRTPSGASSVGSPPRDGTPPPDPITPQGKRALEGAIREYAEAFGVPFSDVRDNIHKRMIEQWGKVSFNDLTMRELEQIMQGINQKWRERQ